MSSSECSSGSASCSSGSQSTCGSSRCSSGSQSTCGSSRCSSGSECSCGKKEAKSGQNWKSQVHFVYDPLVWGSQFKPRTLEFDNGSLTKTVRTIWTKSSQQILEIWVYKCYLRNMPQVTNIFLNHQFVVIKSTNYWWSIEKDDRRIIIYRSQVQGNVLNFVDAIDQHGEHLTIQRRLPVTELSHDKGRPGKTMQDLVDFLNNENELYKPYKLLDDNCQDFAKRIFDEFAVGKKHGKVVGSDGCAVS